MAQPITRSEFVSIINDYIRRTHVGTGDVKFTSNASMTFALMQSVRLEHRIYRRLDDIESTETFVYFGFNKYPINDTNELIDVLMKVREIKDRPNAVSRIPSIESYFKFDR